MIYILFRKSSCSTSDFNFLQLTRSRLLRSTRFSLSIFGPWFRSDSTDQFADFRNNMPSALIILSEGAEEIETVVVADVLTRGKIDVTIAGLHGSEPVVCSRNVIIKPGASLSEVVSKTFDVIVLPGGLKGAENLAKSSLVGELLKKQEKRDGLIACICAAPIAMAAHKIASGKKVTSYPSFEQKLNDAGYQYSTERVVSDGKIITSRGPGTSFEFALTILEKLVGKEGRDAVEEPLLLK